jgi:hypothetical protein
LRSSETKAFLHVRGRERAMAERVERLAKARFVDGRRRGASIGAGAACRGVYNCCQYRSEAGVSV